MTSVTVRSPTRVDLAGGTLDLWPLYSFIGPCRTINVAISVWTEAHLSLSGTSEIRLNSKDVNLNLTFANLEELLKATDPRLKMFQVVVEYFKPKQGFVLSTQSESPVGGGLGGSSSLMISMLKAFAQILDRPWANTYQLVQVAHNLEAQILLTPTGTQDYFPAASGGLNILSYRPEGVSQTVHRLRGTEIENAFLLVNTGKSHHSGLNNFEVLKSAVARDQKVLSALRDLQKVSEELVETIETPHFEAWPELFQREYKARVQLTPAFTSPEIEKLREISLGAGAAAIKICGAGGGGCVLIWAPRQKAKVAEACQREGFQVMNVSLVEPL